MNAPTRPATKADETPIDFPSIKAPRVPADLAALVVEMLEARRDFRLGEREREETP